MTADRAGAPAAQVGVPSDARAGIPGYLLLEDGRRFSGLLSGGPLHGLPALDSDPGVGEVVFQTGMTGYQEVVTDPSYRGQIVTFTAPHIGNVGVNRFDAEAPVPALAGVVVRSLCHEPSSWRSEEPLPAYLARFGVPVLSEVDTRALTRHLREAGSLRGVLAAAATPVEEALARVRAFPGLVGRDLVSEVAPAESMREWLGSAFLGGSVSTTDPWARAEALAEEFPTSVFGPDGRRVLVGKRITLVHCGMKEGIDAALKRRGARVRIVRPDVHPGELLAGDPDGVFLSNGPGDPDALGGLITTVRAVLGRVPLQGICLGFQVLALALGGTTYKMKYGHHGLNHPIRDLESGRVLVTSQNHGFAVDPEALEKAVGSGRLVRTHQSLNDGTFEGFRVPELRVSAVQFHPEACGGPHDGRVLLADFTTIPRFPFVTESPCHGTRSR